MNQQRPFRPVREEMSDGVVHFRCPNCSPDYRKIIAKGQFTGWVEARCKYCGKYTIFREPPLEKPEYLRVPMGENNGNQ
jgi:predicted RNA-binding Zn-ribbon protein involved in translation (DUF1610 family)